MSDRDLPDEPTSSASDALFARLRQPGLDDELTTAPAVAAMFAARVSAEAPRRVHPMIPRTKAGRIAVTVSATLLFAGTAAAAASGSLSTPFSSSRPVIQSETTIDNSSTTTDGSTTTTDGSTTTTDGSTTTTDNSTTTSDSAKGPDANGPAKFGLCTAWSHGAKEKSTTSPAFNNLRAAAAAAGMTVDEFCAADTSTTVSGETTTTDATDNTEDTGTTVAPGAEAGAHSQAGTHVHGSPHH